MNKRQKILAVVGIVAVVVWAFVLADSGKMDAITWAGAIVIVVAWAALHFVLK